MRALFPEYYKLTTKELEKMSDQAIVAFDASYLLDLYRFSQPTTETMFTIMTGLREQIWLPNQCALEFHKNRLNVLGTLRSKHAELLKRVDKDGDALIKGIEDGCAKHPLLDAQSLSVPIREALAKALAEISSVSDKHPKASLTLDDDPIWMKLEKLFDGRVGRAYSGEETKLREDEAKKRFALSIPPGFADQKKDKPYGDYILWRQLLDHCKAENRPGIFISSDVKLDWWLEERGQKHGGLPQLRREFLSETGQDFHLYETTHFIEIYAKRFNQAFGPSVEEIRKLRSSTEQLLRERVLAEGRRHKMAAVKEQILRAESDRGKASLDYQAYELSLIKSIRERELMSDLDVMRAAAQLANVGSIEDDQRRQAKRALTEQLALRTSAEQLDRDTIMKLIKEREQYFPEK